MTGFQDHSPATIVEIVEGLMFITPTGIAQMHLDPENMPVAMQTMTYRAMKTGRMADRENWRQIAGQLYERVPAT